MFEKIRKRDGREVPFDPSKITEAIFKAAKAQGGEDYQKALELTLQVMRVLGEKYEGNIFSVEDVQDVVEKVLIENGHARTAKAYILYRAQRTRYREGKSELMDVVGEILKETNRENANVGNSPSAKMLQIASAASKQYYLDRLIPPEFSNAHRQGDIHIHDLDFYGKTLNCIQIPLRKLLQEGFNNGHGYIRPPKRPASATALAAIILQSSQNDMFGGQSFPFFDRDLAPFVENASDEETYQAMEALVYNLNSMHSRAGAQVPFSSLNLGSDTSEAGRRVTRNLLLAYEAGLGRGENPIFPNIIFRVKEGVNLNPEDPNHDLLLLAMRVAAKRMNPTFSFMDSSFNKEYGDEVAYMGCRTRVIANIHGPAVTERRGNLSFTTINLPRLALRAKGSLGEFYRLLESTVWLACEQLHHRYRVQAALKVKDLPFVMGQHLYMGSEGLGLCDPIEEAVKHGTLSVGFIGLAETLVCLTGKHHGESDDSQAIGISIVQFMRQLVDRAAEQFNLNYTLIATPAEGLSGRFIAMDRERFGVIPGVTDGKYYTNSFHIPVDYDISLFEKMTKEGPYHKYTNAGHISYVEFPAPPVHNGEAIQSIVNHMRNCDMGYAGINFPIDFCESCGLLGVIDQEKCPKCGGDEIKRVRRITGYLSTVDRFNDAKIAELKNRRPHRLS
ncbi:MAG: anaerobic ribonucleoside-triphosphate reductase [Syntrophomonadaceae bacterium]|nr:anaerobic ribonucleoside-triphosphate reductase [Syntrophomonadaceae bacterium]